MDVALDYLAEKFFSSQASTFHILLFGRSLLHAAHTYGMGSYIPYFRVDYLRNLFGISMHWKLYILPIYLFNPLFLSIWTHFYQYGLMYIYFILYTIIHYDIIFLFKLFQLGSSFRCPFDILPSMGFLLLFWASLFCGTTKCYRIILYISCSRIGHLSWVLIGEW